MAEKPMSSRLMQMKFMQRAAASPSNTPPSKRQRLTNGHANPRHLAFDLQAMRAAVAAEDAKRQRALEQHGAEQGETRWKLSVREVPKAAGLALQTAGFAELDTPESDEEDQDFSLKQTSLRMTYGKRKERNSKSADDADDADSADGSSGDSEYDPLGVDDLIERGKEAANTSNSVQRSPERIRSISGPSTRASAIKCYKCGGPHKIANCPSTHS